MKNYNHNKLNVTLSGLLTITLLTLSFSSAPVSANQVVSARYVNAIQTKQAKSIEEGVKLGRLTPKEARKLRKEQHEILSTERDMRKDGALNASELGKLFASLQYAQDHINKLLRNNISTHAIASH